MIWWKHDEGSFEEDLKPFSDDGDASELAVYVVENNCEVEIFCEEKLVTGETTFMDRGVHFDYSEKEIMKGFDERLDEGLGEGVDVGVDGESITEPVANNEAPSEPDKKIFIT
ncbi:hypothetical protein KIW84_053939 [Lathyrus oleraceus]|uniref:Uncharacterized protein n=1 Tax=Pisum sativum TaxID=3888 RepID=A0A9D5AHG5_PEA|nr:hypothetical protein KIW84_053939 [Pisum sativum]